MVPFTPPSLVTFERSASGVNSGWAISVPTSDQVPELIYAQGCPSSIAGTAATALAVS